MFSTAIFPENNQSTGFRVLSSSWHNFKTVALRVVKDKKKPFHHTKQIQIQKGWTPKL